MRGTAEITIPDATMAEQFDKNNGRLMKDGERTL
jgi:hypothetical protein